MRFVQPNRSLCRPHPVLCAAVLLSVVAGCIADPDELTTSTPLPPEARDGSADEDPPDDTETAFLDSSVLRYSAPFSSTPPIINDDAGRVPGVALELHEPYELNDGRLQIADTGSGAESGHATSQPDVVLPDYFTGLFDNNHDFTVEFFVHTGDLTFPDGIAESARVFSVAQPGAREFLSGGFVRVDGELHVQLRLPDRTLDDPLYVSTYDVYPDRHHHIAFTYHADYNDITTYVDGRRVSSRPYHRFSSVAAPEPLDRLPFPLFGEFDPDHRLTLGNRPGPPDRFFSGTIYHVAIHDHAWNSAAISEMNNLHREQFCEPEGCPDPG